MSETSYTLKLVKESQQSKVGVTFRNDDDGNLRVSKLDPNGLAGSNGLRVGDIVTEINGIPVTTTDRYVAAKMLREAEGDLNIVAAASADFSTDDGFFDIKVANVSKSPEQVMQLIVHDEALLNLYPLSFVLVVFQALVCMILYHGFEYDSLDNFTMDKYVIYRDIMVMLLLGFGYLMTFLEKYGLGAVGFTMLLSVINMECNLLVEGWATGSTIISMDSIINAEFSAAALLITFGALIGRCSPLEMCLVAIAEAVFYALNKVFIVFGLLKAEDVGGTITIHMFGAYFGLACAYTLGSQEKVSASNNSSSRVSDVFSLIGTTLLWVYWPSFVGATETGVPSNEFNCTTNTIMSLIGSTCATFFLSQYLNLGKFDAVHIQNSTLAGGVAVGATARLAMGPGLALFVGIIAGLISVLGYTYSSDFLENKFGIFDTCGVGNLHGYPSLWGGIASILLVLVDNQASFLNYGLLVQSVVQFLAVMATMAMAILSGYITGSTFLGKSVNADFVIDYEDAVWWLGVE